MRSTGAAVVRIACSVCPLRFGGAALDLLDHEARALFTDGDSVRGTVTGSTSTAVAQVVTRAEALEVHDVVAPAHPNAGPDDEDYLLNLN